MLLPTKLHGTKEKLYSFYRSDMSIRNVRAAERDLLFCNGVPPNKALQRTRATWRKFVQPRYDSCVAECVCSIMERW